MAEKRKTRAVKVGGLIIGGDFPVSVQTMWKKSLSDRELPEVDSSLKRLSSMGCDLVRFAVPDSDAAELLGRLSRTATIPLVADIHFDYRLALRCMDFPIAKIRINPGNIGESWKVKEVAEKAAGNGIPIRIGVNAGSLPSNLRAERDIAAAMVLAAESELNLFEKIGFQNIIFSLKSSDVEEMVKANTLFAKRFDYPLHIGVTEAGPLIPGLIKNTLGVTSLLMNGIGDTVRVSLTSSSEDEVKSGVEMLRVLKLRKTGIQIIACPQCGRSSFNVKGFLEDVSDFIQSIKNPLTIAVMGCPVNGPGEAKKADLGITGAGKYALIFTNGSVFKKVPYGEAIDAFKQEVRKKCAE